jgi:hypothetical protein
VPLSKDPQKRANQLKNLRPENLRPDAAVKHGARSEAIVQELSSGYQRELRERFPAESDYWVTLQARRMAKIKLIGEYLEKRPSIVLNLRTGKLNPAAAEEESLSKALLADLERADARRRDAGGSPAAGLEALRQRGAQIIDDRMDGDVSA